MLVRMRGAGVVRKGTDEWNHPDHHVAVIVSEAWQSPRNFDVAAEFFFDFSNQGTYRGLILLHFAAGKLPFQPKVLVRRTLRQQHSAA